MNLASEIKEGRILIKDQDGKGSCYAYYAWFHNAINQRRQIAFDGRKWFVQPTPRKNFEPVGESEVPENIRQEFLAYIENKREAFFS